MALKNVVMDGSVVCRANGDMSPIRPQESVLVLCSS
jgi:hypothetical protein